MRRRRRRPLAPGRGTLLLGALATASLATVIAVKVKRARKRGSDEAVADVARVARAGYRDVPTRENSMFNLLTSFATVAGPASVRALLNVGEKLPTPCKAALLPKPLPLIVNDLGMLPLTCACRVAPETTNADPVPKPATF